MRVITGTARGRQISSLPGLSTRPTSSRTKEAMMSIIQFEVEGALVVDLFAGTGQLGIEALSRGAISCSFVELNREAEHVITENLKHTKLISQGKVYRADVSSWLARNTQAFDIAFLDPPYDKNILPEILPLLVPHMKKTGIILCESSLTDDLPEHIEEFSIKKSYKHGKRKVTQYRVAQEIND